MTAATQRSRVNEPVLAANGEPINKRSVLLWEVGAFFFIMIVASALHFAFELSGFSTPVAVFGSVNESSFEHLKLFFWPALVFALVQHAYLKGTVNNYWWGKGLAMVVTPLGILASFYLYLGIVLPITGTGYLALDIGTGAFGVLLGNIVAYKLLTAPERGSGYRTAGFVMIGVAAVLMATSAWIHPEMFLYENFWGYEYAGEYGILDDYTPYLIFTEG